jgi:hypothetical protein
MEIIDAPERANERLFLDRLPAREFRRQTLPPPDRRIARARRRQSTIWQPTPNVFTALLRDSRNILAESFAPLERLEEPSTSREPP